MRRGLVLRAAQILIIAVVAWGVWRVVAPGLAGVGAEDFLHWRPDAARLLISIALLLCLYLAHAFLWRRIMSDLGVGRPTAGATIRMYFLASLGRYLPGKLWQLAGIAVLARNAGLPPAGAAAAAVLGQFGFLATGLLLLAILLPEWAGGVPAAIGAAMLILVAAAFWTFVATPLGHGLRERLLARAGPRGGAHLGAVFDLADRIRPRAALVWLAGYGLTWILLGMAFTIFTAAFVPAAIADARALSGSLAASYLGGLVALVPAGIGVREGALAALLGGVPSVPVPAAIVVALSSRVWFTIVELIPLLALPFLRQPEAGATHRSVSP